ncbi:MAG: hypothetical protein R6U04_06060 [Bacteroidales bacterium]
METVSFNLASSQNIHSDNRKEQYPKKPKHRLNKKEIHCGDGKPLEKTGRNRKAGRVGNLKNRKND